MARQTRRSWCRFLAWTAIAAFPAAGGFSSVARAADTDWPRWRGANFDDKSTETGLLKEWPKDGPALVWTATGIGRGYSSVAVAGGKVFTMGEDSKSTYVYALDPATGKKLWSTNVGKPGGGPPGPRGTPTVEGDNVYIVSQVGEVACLQAATGAEVWRKNLNKDFDGKMMSGWGNSESPLVDGDRLIVTPGGKSGTLLALNKLTGEPLWRTTDLTDSAAYTGAIAATLAGKRQYVQLTDKSVVGIDPDNGKILWRAARKGDTAVVPTPIVADDCVYVTSGYGVGCDKFKVSVDGAGFKAEKVFTNNKTMVNHHGGVLLVEGKVYGFSDGKGWTCQDFESGKVIWSEKGKMGKGALTYADGMLYLRGEEKPATVALIEASPAGYKEHGRLQLPHTSSEMQWAHLAISGGKLYVRDQDNLFCYDVKAK